MPPDQADQPTPGVLVVKIGAHEPVSLSLVARLLGALAQDYRGVTAGRDLTVENIHQGSLVAFLRDLADWADQANHLLDFANHIAGIMTGAIAETVLLRSRGRQNGRRTALAVAELAIKAKTRVRIVHQGRRGDTLVIDVDQEGGEAITRAAAADTELARPAPRLDFPLEALENAAIQAAESEEVDSLSVLLRELVGIIRQRSEGQRQLDALIHRLRRQGLDKAANLLAGL